MKAQSVPLSCGYTIEFGVPVDGYVPLAFHRTGAVDPFPSEVYDFEVWLLVRALVGSWVRMKLGRCRF